jgi:hypothetical protein
LLKLGFADFGTTVIPVFSHSFQEVSMCRKHICFLSPKILYVFYPT